MNKFLLILLAVSLLGNFYLWRSLQAEGQRADQATAHADQLVNSAQERVSTAAQARDQMQEMLARVGALASELSQGLDEIKTLTGATEVVSTDPASESGGFVESLVEGATDLAPPSQSLGEVLDQVSESAGEASEASREMLDEAAGAAAELAEQTSEAVSDTVEAGSETLRVAEGSTASEVAASADAAATDESQASEEPAFPEAVGARGEGGARSRVDELLEIFGRLGDSGPR